MKAMEWLVLVAGGAALFLIAENNLPQFKEGISQIQRKISSQIISVSTAVPQGPIAPGSRAGCPLGMYEDWTDGILRCKDPGHTRELNPNVKPMISPWQHAYGSAKVVDNNYWEYATSQRKQDEHRNEETLYPDIPESIAKTVLPPTKRMIDKTEAQQRRQEERKKRKKHQTPKLEPPSRDKLPPSITAPPNFPGSVTIAPGETPYPETEDEVEAGGGGTPGDIPSSDTPIQLPGGRFPGTPITPTVPVTPPTPPAVGGIGQVFFPFSPAKDHYTGFASHPYDANGCRVVDYKSGGSGRTCRWQAPDKLMRSMIGENGYKIEATLHIGDPATTKDKEISITSGGPGSAAGNCCGFATRINIDTGELQLEAEGAQTDTIFCKGASCTNGGPTSIGKNLYGKDVKLTWIATKRGNNVTYQAIATGPSGIVVSKQLINAKSKSGHVIIPFHYISVGKKGMASDPHRIRVDSCKTVDFHSPKVTVIPSNAYYGAEGFIDDQGLLI
jgi:hypothetical protein